MSEDAKPEGGGAASTCEPSGVRMSEHHTTMHTARHHGKALRMQSVRDALTSAWKQNRLICYKWEGFIEGSYTLPTYYFALQQS